MNRRVYLDHNASTPVHPEVVEAMLPYFAERFGNPSSVHAFGREAREGLETAREQIAHFLRVGKEEIVFTSGGTESDNMAVKGVAMARGRGHIINVSSMLGRIPFASGRAAYSAAKHALCSLTANFRMDLREQFPEIRVTTVFPGVVATDFGLKALGGGPDSRALPGAQPVGEVADVILDVIEHPRAEVYTRPGLREQVAAYYAAEDRDAVESRLPPVPGR